MPRFAFVNSGTVSDVVESEEQPEGWIPCVDAAPGWTYNGETGQFSPPVLAADPRNITVGSFQRRIGVMTTFAINTSANEICVALRTFVATLRFVNLDDPDTAAMLGMLAINGLPAANAKFPGSGPITQEKIQAILSAPVQESERP